MLTGNSAQNGGGASGGTLDHCALTANSATGTYGFGGGASSSILNNCALTGNSASWEGGGAAGGTLNDCTLTGNSAQSGGGAASCGLNNCILYYNTASNDLNCSSCALNYCCTTPDPGSGAGNITAEPQLASASHLSAGSPCRGAGSPAYATGVDIDGEPWLNPPSIGCDEYRAGAQTGELTAAIAASWTNVAVGFAVDLTGWISGWAAASAWDFGDGTVLSNRPYATHAWGAPGDYAVVLRAYNETYPAGVSATLTIRVVESVHYVSAVSASPEPPYSSWATAARTIQEAVDVAVPGGQVVVTNGLYATGGRAVFGMMTNRVAVDRPVALRSVNGPEVTVIQGCQVPGTTNGDGAVRCVYLTSGAVLNGFALAKGATRGWDGDPTAEQSGGGVWCESAKALVTNCTLMGNSAYARGGGAYSGTLKNCTLTDNWALQYGGAASSGTLGNCTLTGNSAQYGGGACEAMLNHCTLKDNSAIEGGGTYEGTLNHCALMGNSAYYYGGGAWYGTLNNCVLAGNSASWGGGAYSGSLSNCNLTANSASSDGGGTADGTLNNCALTGNSAYLDGGGACYAILNNCTLTGNSARAGGGASSSTLNNSILYYNTASSDPNYSSCALNYCSTTPNPGSGFGNITAEPQLASASHLSANSPCRGAGSADYATGLDIDGEPWLSPPSIGCDEYQASAHTGELSVAIAAFWTNVAVGFAVDLTGWISGRAATSAWDFGDGTVLSNRPYASHAWNRAGDYAVVLRAYNETYPAGVSATLTIRVVESVHYVSVVSASPEPPYKSWATAARTIQEAVDMAVPGGQVVVTNGVYATGGRAVFGMMTNRVAVDRPVVVRSVNGPEVTVIQGFQVPENWLGIGNGAMRCVYLTNGAVLSGFTLADGGTCSSGDWEKEGCGGGVWCESPKALVTNCTLTGNSAQSGGGAYGGTLSHCTLAENLAGEHGGGAYDGTLNDCVLIGNSAYFSGGGAYEGTLSNCTLTGNSAPNGSGGGAYGGGLWNCVLAGNSASGLDGSGGGASAATLDNCTLTGNSATGMYSSAAGPPVAP